MLVIDCMKHRDIPTCHVTDPALGSYPDIFDWSPKACLTLNNALILQRHFAGRLA